MFNDSLLALVASPDGTILTSFATTTPEAWADQQMLKRYGQVITEADAADSFPRACWAKLVDERAAVATWFDGAGKVSPTLQSIFMVNRMVGPIDDGLGWDFEPDGKPCQRMLVFKGTLLAVCRTAALIQVADRHGGNMQFGGLAALVKSAYTERARLHTWRGYQGQSAAPGISGADMSARWVAYRSFLFLLALQAAHHWAWEASNCRRIFGPVCEPSGLL